VSEGACPVVAVVVGDGEDAWKATSDHAGPVSGQSDEAAAATDLQALLTPAETLGEYDAARVRDFFDVSDTELAATDGTLADAVRERVALLVVEK